MHIRLPWLDRLLLVPRLRARMGLREFQRGYVTLYAIECSESEVSELESIDTTQILRLGRGMQHYLGMNGPIPNMRIFCFGCSAQLNKTPIGLRRWLIESFSRGFWLQQMKAAIALFADDRLIRQVVIHELTHGLLDVLTKGFPYPIAISEGFACRAEYLLPDQTGTSVWERRSSKNGRVQQHYCEEAQCMSIKDMLFFDVNRHWGDDMAAFARMSHMSSWLNVYVRKLGRQQPVLRTMLSELRARNIRTREGVYEWLQEASGMGDAELERSFHSFCTAGVIPRIRSNSLGNG